MTEKRFHYRIDEVGIYYYICDNTKKSDDRIILELGTKYDAIEVCNVLNSLNDENEQLKKENNKLKRFEYGGEHIRLSINIETGDLQRHIYATGQWFGDFDRVLVDNIISKEDYQKFIDRVIEVYNTEFKKR